MPNILHIVYPGPGGLSEVGLSLVEEAVRSHPGLHSVLFYGRDPLFPPYARRCQNAGVQFHHIPKRPGWDLAGQRQIAALLARESPGIVLSHLTQALPAAWLYRRRHPSARTIFIEHHSNALKRPLDWALTALGPFAADHCVYLSESYLQEVQAKLGPLTRAPRLSVIPNGVDTTTFTPAPSRRTIPFTIGTQARMVPGKDYDTLLEAFALFRECAPGPVRLQCAGDGPDWPRIEARCGELGLGHHVDWLGMLPKDDLIQAMQSWDVFVLATCGENMSRAVMEAQSCALPVVASAVSGMENCVQHETTGLLVPPADPSALASALTRLHDDDVLRERLGTAARDQALSTFSIGTAWSRYAHLVDRLSA